MKCPKCGKEQAASIECESCGLVFEKYRQRLNRPLNEKRPTVVEPSRKGLFILSGGIIVVVVLLSGSFLFNRTELQAPLALVDPESFKQREVAKPEAAAITYGLDIVAQLNKNSPASNPIEQARNATVLIKTPWGLGSGFFVTDNCAIISNRHVVQLSAEEVAEFKTELSNIKTEEINLKIDIEKDKAWLKKYYDNNPDPYSRDPRSKRFEGKIVKKEKELVEVGLKIQSGEAELENMLWNNELKIILADGSELSGFASRISDDHDLALVKINGGGYCPSISAGNTADLHQGDRLYTVGSPMGVRHTVTSGIYSGSIELDGNTMLQTDAPINPGNSGGPLISQDGKVLGVNTLVLRKSQGIGFAIPIEQAMQSLNIR